MKVLIVSDIHGNFNNMKKVMQDVGSVDRILILGDVLNGFSGDGYNPNNLASLLNLYKDKIVYVKGNCDNYNMNLLDFYVEKNYITISIDGKLFFMTHGHIYSRYNLPSTEFDVFIQGHTHVPMMESDGSRLYLNPGSITNPRGGSGRSYILYENGIFNLISLDSNKIIKKIGLN